MFDLIDKVVLVTGAANGIGAAIVREFLKEGVKFVSILDIEEKSGDHLEKELAIKHGKDKVKFFKCDVTKDDELFAAFKKTIDQNGGLDVVVNNAGIANDEMYKKEIEINFTALVTSTLKALESMREDKGGKGGTIINVSSVSALALLSPAAFIYGATKAAVLHFNSSIGKEAYYSKTKVRTITTCLGATNTDMISEVRSFDEELARNMKTIMKYDPLQTAEEAAKGVVEAYKRGGSGSTWLIWCKVQDITDRVNKGYESMAGDIFD
ncbi:15-hydroxyprostaglandin dehydrogenase [NAD(+)]-like [Maniola hyperantus]|uniref:15-hydroxyprostaglandin dehydrogenase [NAD(+)]-like n=1 Tax=Aphantopus hyperantus TaxID=2795564 RepID=UPI0015690189|nr:15-hydroxyprostaglandin dehydrogenase [NAD(+)]-like [Maniola hyperantus]